MPRRLGSLLLLAVAGVSAHGAEPDVARADAERTQAKAEAAILAELKTEQLRAYAASALQQPGPPLINSLDLPEGAVGELMLIEDYQVPVARGEVKSATVIARSQDFLVSQIVDKKTVIVDDFRIWIEGIDTRQMVDDRAASFAGYIFQVKGTKRYDTAIGAARTIKRLVAIDVTQAQAAVARVRALREYRAWVSESGDHAVRAKFRDFKGGDVILLTPEGKELKVPMTKLSKPDQQWVRDEVKKRKTVEKKQERGRTRGR